MMNHLRRHRDTQDTEKSYRIIEEKSLCSLCLCGAFTKAISIVTNLRLSADEY